MSSFYREQPGSDPDVDMITRGQARMLVSMTSAGLEGKRPLSRVINPSIHFPCRLTYTGPRGSLEPIGAQGRGHPGCQPITGHYIQTLRKIWKCLSGQFGNASTNQCMSFDWGRKLEETTKVQGERANCMHTGWRSDLYSPTPEVWGKCANHLTTMTSKSLIYL